MMHKLIHKMSILSTAETDFCNFAMTKGDIGIFRSSIDWFNGIKIYLESFVFVKYILKFLIGRQLFLC